MIAAYVDLCLGLRRPNENGKAEAQVNVARGAPSGRRPIHHAFTAHQIEALACTGSVRMMEQPGRLQANRVEAQELNHTQFLIVINLRRTFQRNGEID